MSRSSIAICLALAFALCTTASAADKSIDMYSGKSRTSDELSVIYNPARFIDKIDRDVLYKSPRVDPDDLVDSIRIVPGDHTIHGMLFAESIHYAKTPYYKERKFRISINTEAGHTYYIYYELVSGELALGARDLGKNFEPAVKSVAQALTPAQRAKNDPYYEQLKTSGVDQPIELVH